MVSATAWILERTGEERFPYRVRLVREGRVLLALRTQDRWPGARGHIFCVRDEEPSEPCEAAVVETVAVVTMQRYGIRLSVVLDRAVNKRCDFLFLKKRYKYRDGEYEQIFWRTQQGLRQRRPRVKLATRGSGSLRVAIDSTEKYPWSFAGCDVERRSLPVGDYALLVAERILAVVERKTFENLLGDFGNLALLHQRLGEMEVYRHAAVVVEARYSDFLSPERMVHYPPAFAARAIAELQAFHPGVPVVFAGNRKLAGAWTFRFFAAVQAQEAVPHPAGAAEALSRYGPPEITEGGAYFRARREILDSLPGEFGFEQARELLPGVSDSVIRRALNHLRKEGKLVCSGRGRTAVWRKEANPPVPESGKGG